MENEKKKALLDECIAYIRYGQNISPARATEMIKDAYKAGYEQAIKNYPVK